jgi:hypothetical protein
MCCTPVCVGTAPYPVCCRRLLPEHGRHLSGRATIEPAEIASVATSFVLAAVPSYAHPARTIAGARSTTSSEGWAGRANAAPEWPIRPLSRQPAITRATTLGELQRLTS